MSYLKMHNTVVPSPIPVTGAIEFWVNTATGTLWYTNPAGVSGPVGFNQIDWINVTQQSTPVLTTNTAAQNITAINAILAAAPNGSTIYFPSGTYQFNAAWTMPNASFTFLGEGSNRAGSPATAFTNLQWTANVAGSLITLASGFWYTQFIQLTFTTTVAQTAGYVVDVNGNVGINFLYSTFQGLSASATFFNCINFAGSNGGNSTVVEACNFSFFTGSGITVNSAGASLVVINCSLQGLWGTATQAATACINAQNVGALQISECNIQGAINNLVIQPAVGQVAASVFCDNTIFNFSFGSCILIQGAGATVRAKFVECSFSTSNGGTAFSAVQVAGTFVFTVVGGQGLDFLNCNILNTQSTTGTTNGIVCTNAADISIQGCRIAGWTNGIQITPITSVTAPVIEGNVIGANGGIVANSVGILLNAGTYISQTIIGNNLANNTTPITDNSTVTTTINNNRIIQKNQVFNPKSVVAQPAFPASTTAVFNSTGVDCTVYVKGGTLTVITVGGVSTGISAATVSGIPIPVAANQSIALTYTVAPTWIWVGT